MNSKELHDPATNRHKIVTRLTRDPGCDRANIKSQIVMMESWISLSYVSILS